MTRFLIAGLMALMLMTPVAQAHGDDDLWIHVAVDGTDDDAERVRVNLPLNLIEVVLPMIEEEEFHHGRIHLDGCEMEHEDIVAILRAVSESQDGEYVTVEDGDDHVRVVKNGDYIHVKVEERHEYGDNVDVKVPLAVLDALISGEEGELDVVAAVRALGEHGGGDLVTVSENDGTLVRVWIDDQNTSD